MNPSLEQKENHGPRAQAGGFGGEGAGGGLKWEGGVSRRQLSCGGWINSKALLYKMERIKHTAVLGGQNLMIPKSKQPNA